MRVAVVGAGVVGLSAVTGLLARGADVVCFERAGAVMSERSAGSSRIFRLAHGTPELVTLARTAQAGFERWQARCGASLINSTGCVISGAGAGEWASAMASAGAAHQVVDGDSDRLRLPARRPPAEALIDPVGGVIDVDAVRRLLSELAGSTVVDEHVYALEHTRSGIAMWSSAGRAHFDVVLLAAGAGTAPLAAQVGIYTPTTLSHHVRFSFPVEPDPGWQSWIDKPADEAGTYQHQSGPGRWSVGGYVDPALTAWELGREAATASSRAAAMDYARERLLVEPEIVDSLYCTHVPELGDGYELRRNGSVLAVYGENLFKLAPVLADVLAEACVAAKG
jgi:sarcosine oxidase